MSRVDVRPVGEETKEAFLSAVSLTYGDGLPIPPERHEPRFGIERYVGTVDGEVAGICSVLPMNATRGAALLPCAGVAGVAVLPEKRRGGVGNGMMDGLVRLLREQGVPLASLYAYREPFYARSGYAVVGKRLRITVPTHRLPKVESVLPIRRLTPDDWELLAPCYAAYAHARSGAHIRNETMWSRVLNENRPLTIYAAGDPVEGYVAVSHKTEFWSEQWFSEVAWSSAEGYRACLELMRQLGINKTAVAWYEPSDSPYYAFHLDQGVEVKVERPVMFRVNDVPAAVAALKPTTEGETRMRIIDNVVPENEGPWRVRFSPQGVEVEPCQGHDVAIDVRQFAQAFMGEPSLADLVRHGAIEGDSSVLERLLPPSPTVCGDFF
ncbi:GNAT family N-acetyltransferase [bacterium]|nr:MAG: GNAT family N-acetyltransferase [bacterium]